VLAAGAGSLATGVPAAGATVPDSFYGVVTQGGNTAVQPADFERMGAGGVGTLRFLLYWPYIQSKKGPCTPSSRYDPGFGLGFDDNYCDWSSIDQLVAGAAAHGVQLLPFLYGSPQWIDSNDGIKVLPDRVAPVGSVADRAAWGHFVQAAVDRYGAGGVFWNEHPQLASAGPIELWQVWNEPGSPTYLQPRPSVSTYAQLLNVSASAIRAADPHAVILLAGLYNNPRTSLGGIPMSAFLRRLYAIAGAASNFDVAALHPYAANISDVQKQIVSARQIMNAHGDRMTAIWITELGWATQGPARDQWVKGIDGQAAALRQSFRLLRAHYQAWRIAGVNWFSWRDVPRNQSSCRSCFSTGLIAQGGQPKPAWRSFVQFSGGR
jgi:Glycosyl hydrolase catalytic core